MNAVATLITDYGMGSPYTATLLGQVLTLMPDLKVVEISHDTPTYDAASAAFLLRSVYKQFPQGTCHLLCVDNSHSLYGQFLVVEKEGHYFMSADNGSFSILFDEPPSQVWAMPNAASGGLFPEKNLFLPTLKRLLHDGPGFMEPARIRNIRQGWLPLVKEDALSGTVMMVDRYMNAITNIHRDLFVQTGKGRPFQAYYSGRHYIDHVSGDFITSESGEEFLIFNENGYLMVGMSRSKGSQLLGLKVGSRLVVEFEPMTDELNASSL